jgi:hypothetical protein
MVRRRSTVRFRNGALAHKHEKQRLTIAETVRRCFYVLRLATVGTGSRRPVAPNTRPSLSAVLGGAVRCVVLGVAVWLARLA